MLSDSDETFYEILQKVLRDRLHFYRIIKVNTVQDVLQHPVVNEPILLAVFDHEMFGLDNLRCLTSIRTHLGAGARVAIASGSADKRNIILALESGAHGYLLKTDSVVELTRSLQLMVNGGIYVPASFADLK